MGRTEQNTVFGSELRTAILVAVFVLEETHASELARALERSVSRIQTSLEGLEEAGLITSAMVGRTRRVRLNPRFFASTPLRELLSRLLEADTSLLPRLAKLRKRPRRKGKSL